MGSMSLIERMKARMDGSLNRQLSAPRVPQRTRHIVRANRWDDIMWKKSRKIESTDELITDLDVGDEHRGGQRKGFDPAPELVEGLFHAFYKAAPDLRKRREVTREAYPALKILQEVMDNPKLQELQEFTVGDAVMSTVAIDSMGDQIREILERIPPPPQDGDGDQQGGGGQGQGQGGGGQGQGDPNGGQGQGQGQGGGQSPEDEGDDDGEQGEGGVTDGGGEDFDPDSEDAMSQAEADWEAQWDEAMGDVDFERMVHNALEAAKNDAEELDSARRGIGLEDGEWAQMSPEERLKMAERLRTPEMRELAAVIGQMKRFALGVRATRIINVPHEAYDVETGNDLRRILRAQFALLGTEETKYEFYRRYIEKELLQYKMRGTEEVGKGPIITAIDKSGSMSGGPFNWAMGVAEALRRFAAEEDRDYYAMFFGNNNDRNRFEFPEGKGPFEKVLSFLSVAANGGTQFDGVLTEALERAVKTFDEAGKGKADIVFITDGQAHLDEDWIKKFNEERERAGIRVYSVYIGGAYDMSYQGGPVDLLNRISDAVIPVSDLKPESARAIFERV